MPDLPSAPHQDLVGTVKGSNPGNVPAPPSGTHHGVHDAASWDGMAGKDKATGRSTGSGHGAPSR